MKKKRFARFLSLVLALALCCSVGILPAMASQRAVSVPTQHAPDTWYNTYHQWTATYYTYSSYIFEYLEYNGAGNTYIIITATALKPFTLELYSASTNQRLYTIPCSVYVDSEGYIARESFNMNNYIEDFYIVLRNNDPSAGSITLADQAYYIVERY